MSSAGHDVVTSKETFHSPATTKPVISSSDTQLATGEYRFKSESRGRLVPVEKEEDLITARDEASSERVSYSDTCRESAPVVPSSRQRKRRASDSFDLQDSDDRRGEDTELIRVSSSAKPTSKSVSREDSLEDEPIRQSERHFILKTPLVKPELSLCVDEVDEDDEPLERLENVTALSRSLIPPELLKPPKLKRTNPLAISLKRNKMATVVTASSSNNNMSTKSNSNSLRRKLSGRLSKKSSKLEHRDENADKDVPQTRPPQRRSDNERRSTKEDPPQSRGGRSARPPSPADEEPMMSRAKPLPNVPPIMTVGSEETPVKSNRTGRSQSPPAESHSRGRPGIVERIRSASRSRSRSRSRKEIDSHDDGRSIMIAVTSCKSDAYHHQKAPGSTSKLPRKAPSNLKLFHELAVGIKDAYAAAGETPTRPDPEEWSKHMTKKEIAGRTVLWEFLGNLDFLLALVDEVAIDTATRGALKDDTTFKSLRDVIKKCNKVLETMLIRRERKYTLFFRLVQATDEKEIEKLAAWNLKVEKAIGSVAEGDGAEGEDTETDESESDTVSMTSGSTDASNANKKGNVFSRGRQLLPTAGRVRARRATPTPRLRQRRASQSDGSDSSAAEDGYSAVTSPITSGNLAKLQRSLDANEPGGLNLNTKGGASQQLAPVKPMEPKDELVDVIRGLRMEKLKNKESSGDSELATLKPNWQPKADIPSAVPKLPPEYIHRHRLMKQVVNSLLERSGGGGPVDTDEEVPANTIITSITSRHGDKAGNGKTILAAAAIQTVEVRERFSDGIAWIHLGRNPLSENDVRRLYEELYRQLLTGEFDMDEDSDDDSKNSSSQERGETRSRGSSLDSVERAGKTANDREYALHLANTRRRFEGGDLEGIKEDIGRLLADRKVLICLDDVWRIEDAKWFIFEGRVLDDGPIRGADMENPFRILITTRTPQLLGQGVVHEVYVRIFSEQEAVKLLLSSGGRRPYGGKNSAVYNQARTIVKGCGNSPLAVRIAGGMLRRSNRNWNLRSPTWTALIQQCRANLDEATTLRSFQNAATRVVDLSFATVENVALRSAMRRCFVTYAAAFRDNEWVLVGRGVPQAVLLKLFATVIGTKGTDLPSPEQVLIALEAMNLLQRARHGCTSRSHIIADSSSDSSDEEQSPSPVTSTFMENPSFLMHESIKAIAEEIGQRTTAAFLPTADEFTSFGREIEAEQVYIDSNQGSFWNPLRYISRSLSNTKANGSQAMEESAVMELLISSLLDVRGGIANASIPDAFRMSKNETKSRRGVDKMEEYLATFLPAHLIRAKAYSSAADILVDPQFASRRVRALGVIESTRRHVADLLELRREASKLVPAPSSGTMKRSKKVKTGLSSGSHDEADDVHAESLESIDFDANAVLRDGARLIIDESYGVVNRSSASLDSLNMAICLAAVGEGLLKGRQPRDAMLRLEEAVGIYRGLLGAYHIDVARALHNVARALVKLGETRVALLKFSEAARIYDACNATLHYDSIANAQNLATLLVDIGDWTQADEKLEEVISMKRSVHGANSVIVAKAINNYAILLAKHGRMNEALVHYQAAMETYREASQPMIRDPEFELKCNYDMTLISLNIASIKSKKGDLEGAIDSYEEGVEGLRSHAEEQGRLGVSSKGNSHNKHLVAALGRIGSLKLKLGDRDGALEAYMTLLQEVDEDSPRSSQVEKAKAHIKCATICRQLDGKGSRIKSISHLREALEMYTELFGPENKDTLAIAASLRQWLTEEREASNKGSALELSA